MPNATCLYGPSFSIAVNGLPDNATFRSGVLLDNPADENSILDCQWFLDDNLLIEENALQVVIGVTPGARHIEVRLRTSGGWSGFERLDFQNYNDSN